jgi:hypothetical protein
LRLVEGEPAERSVPPAGSRPYSQVSWKVKGLRAGPHAITVNSNTGLSQTHPVSIRTGSIFD